MHDLLGLLALLLLRVRLRVIPLQRRLPDRARLIAISDEDLDLLLIDRVTDSSSPVSGVLARVLVLGLDTTLLAVLGPSLALRLGFVALLRDGFGRVGVGQDRLQGLVLLLLDLFLVRDLLLQSLLLLGVGLGVVSGRGVRGRRIRVLVLQTLRLLERSGQFVDGSAELTGAKGRGELGDLAVVAVPLGDLAGAGELGLLRQGVLAQVDCGVSLIHAAVPSCFLSHGPALSRWPLLTCLGRLERLVRTPRLAPQPVLVEGEDGDLLLHRVGQVLVQVRETVRVGRQGVVHAAKAVAGRLGAEPLQVDDIQRTDVVRVAAEFVLPVPCYVS